MDRGLEQFIFAALILLAGLLDWVVRSLKNRSSPRAGQPTAKPDPAEPFPEDEEEPWSEPRDIDWEPSSEQIPERPAAPAPAPSVPPRVEVFTVPQSAEVFTVPQSVPRPAIVRSPATAVPARRRRRNRWVNDALDARRGLVLLEILGPCKGLESPRRRE